MKHLKKCIDTKLKDKINRSHQLGSFTNSTSSPKILLTDSAPITISENDFYEQDESLTHQTQIPKHQRHVKIVENRESKEKKNLGQKFASYSYINTKMK